MKAKGTKRNWFVRSTLRQHNTGYLIGAARQLFSSAQFYLAFVNFSMIAVLAYDGSFGDKLREWFPWLNFILYFSFFVVGYLLICLFEWKIVFPSNISLSNWQGYQSSSRIRRDMKQVHNELLEIREEMVKMGADEVVVKEGPSAAWSDDIDKWQKEITEGW